VGACQNATCPVEGCDYAVTIRLGVGDEANGSAMSEVTAGLRAEHPDHPREEPSAGSES
jgi:hypothetical protein